MGRAPAVAGALALAVAWVCGGLQAQVPSFSGTAEVVASRVAEAAEQTGRRQVVLTREEIADLPVRTVGDVLALLPGVGLTRRGAFGVQGDLNLRGGTFEQALVLVNGVRVANPQTGHHNLDLFIPLDAIERIEMVYGPGSSAYGPGAFGGAINIVTGAPATTAHAGAGSHGYLSTGLALPLGRRLWGAAERTLHTGFRPDTESSFSAIAAGWRWANNAVAIDVGAATGRRAFGAWRFYSTRFPNERERTSGGLATFRLTVDLGRLRVTSYARADRHRDVFILDRARPDWYVNRHRTDGLLGGATLGGSVARWRWTVGAEAARDDLRSSNLGRHHRVQSAFFGEAGWFGERLTADLQLRVDRQRPWGRVTTLAGGGSWRLGRGITLRAHHGQSFRAPSFTELDYRSPATAGNPLLEPERGSTTEAGLDWGAWSISAFRRSAHPLIDFVLGGDGVWRAANVGGLTTSGLEVALSVPASGPLLWQRFGAVWLDSSLDADPARSSYALAHPRLEAAWTGAVRIGAGWSGGWAARFRSPNGGGSWAALDLRLGRRILSGTRVIVEAANVFDRSITELHGIPLPRRWLIVRLEWRDGTP